MNIRSQVVKEIISSTGSSITIAGMNKYNTRRYQDVIKS